MCSCWQCCFVIRPPCVTSSDIGQCVWQCMLLRIRIVVFCIQHLTEGIFTAGEDYWRLQHSIVSGQVQFDRQCMMCLDSEVIWPFLFTH